LGIILAVNDTAGQFSKASAIAILLLLGCLAFLAGLAQLARRVRPATARIVVEPDIRDPLTSLPNQRYLLVRLEEEMVRSRRGGRPLTLAILDVNSLAAVNEQYGRDCGDEVVRHVAAVAEETKRATDALARMDDDEFAIILPECGDEGGQAFVRRLTERLAREPVSALLNSRPSHVWVGVCVGLATVGSDEDTPASLLDRARADLVSSREGRDRRRQLWRTA
jgi:diguanylate cyclase (GGDEF)-like protein